jgi:hypothetical protein
MKTEHLTLNNGGWIGSGGVRVCERVHDVDRVLHWPDEAEASRKYQGGAKGSI